MKRLKYLLLASLVAFAACDEEDPIDPSTQTGSVRVTVTAGGSPLQGVTVSLGAAGTSPVTTGADGIANFPTVQIGSYTVTVSGLGSDVVCGSTTQPVTVATGQQTAVTFACNVVSTSSISGTVADANGAPKPGATVVITRTLPAPAGTAVNVTTNTQGQYSLTGLRSGTYTVVLNTLTGCTTAATTQTVVVAAGEARVVNFVCTVAPPVPTIDSATVAIQNITTAGGGQIPTTAVMGTVIVNMGVEEGEQRVSRVELVLDRPQGDTIVYTQTFASTAPALEGVELATFNVQATVNTAAFNPNTGAVAFLNGQHTLTARVFVTNRTTPQHVARVPITLTNIDFIQINTTTNGNQAFDNGGLTWRSGALTATALPVLYSGGTLTQVTLDVRAIGAGNVDAGPAGNADPITDSVAPFVVTWPVRDTVNTAVGTDNDVGEVATPVYVRAVSSSKAGQPGPSDPTTPPTPAASNFQRLDNVAPIVPGTLNALTWIGAPTTVDTLKVPLGNITDPGVGRVVFRVQYVVPPATASADTAWITVNTVADIPETVVTNQTFLVRLRVEDALGNTTFTNATGPLGVDRQAPVITIVAPDPNIRIHNAQGTSVDPDLRFQVTDVGSQFGGTSPLQLRVTRTARTNPSVVCVNPNDNSTTAVPSGGCPFVVDTDGTYVPSGAGDGYYDVTAGARDVAGNFATQVSRTVLIDTTAPEVTITSTTVTTPPGGGTQIQVSATARDNVDLRATDTRLRFADATVLPITMWQGETGFGTPLDTIRSVNSGIVSPLLRRLGASPVDGAGVGAVDVSRLEGQAFSSVSVTTADPLPAFTSIVLSLSGTTICNGTTASSTLTNASFSCGNTGTSRTATVAITVAGSAANPFSTLNLYARNLVTGAVRLIGQTTSMPVTLGPDFVYTGSISISGSTLQLNNLAGSDYAIFAVPFTTAGDAAMSNVVNLDALGVPNP